MRITALTISRLGVFSALYGVLSLIPISTFIGAPSLLTLNLIVTPTIAIILNPFEAFFASLFGGMIAIYLSPFQAIFGPLTILLPITGSTLGSMAYHMEKKGTLPATLFLTTAILMYLMKNYLFPYFIIPHLIAILMAIISSFKVRSPKIARIIAHSYITTMCEQGMMMIFAVYLLGLPWFTFIGVLPLMIYERLLGTIGGTLLALSLTKIGIIPGK